MEATCCNTSTTVLTEPTNSEDETFKQSDPTRPTPTPEAKGVISIHMKVKVNVGVLNSPLLEEGAMGDKKRKGS